MRKRTWLEKRALNERIFGIAIPIVYPTVAVLVYRWAWLLLGPENRDGVTETFAAIFWPISSVLVLFPAQLYQWLFK